MSAFERAPELERALLTAAVPYAGIHFAHELIDFAHERAEPGPVRGRPMKPEARQELADLANYIPWAAARGELTGAQVAEAGALLTRLWQIVR